MIIFDFFSGTGSSTQAFRDAGHTVISFELNGNFVATEHVNVMDLTAEYLIEKYGQPDFIWASPPCTAFSIASVPHHWEIGGKNPIAKSELAEESILLVSHTLNLIKTLKPRFGWLMENPRGMLRKLKIVAGIPRRTLTYCQYGEKNMKPTDLWGYVHGWTPRTPCKNGMPCHEPAPRGSHNKGIQGLMNAEERSRVPYELGKEILEVMSER
jgi:site-specific DNA-cytosine methylase